MRGRRSSSGARAGAARNTPAYAGKTLSGGGKRKYREKHPRVCGEDLHIVTMGKQKPETPPRMRGRHHCGFEPLNSAGNTPAYAGKTTM